MWWRQLCIPTSTTSPSQLHLRLNTSRIHQQILTMKTPFMIHSISVDCYLSSPSSYILHTQCKPPTGPDAFQRLASLFLCHTDIISFIAYLHCYFFPSYPSLFYRGIKHGRVVHCRYTVVLYSTYIDITSHIIDIIILIHHIIHSTLYYVWYSVYYFK